MDAQELLGKVRKIEIRARGLSRNVFAGEYHSAFRGRGMAFSEVREYQYGDDVRDIDWNVTCSSMSADRSTSERRSRRSETWPRRWRPRWPSVRYRTTTR